MMQTVIKQMWDHPYQGAIARMYLEGKVLELLALQLSQLLEAERVCPPTRKLHRQDIDRLYQAQAILQQEYLNPPSVIDLARILLQDEELTVTTVANRVGYSNVSYFSRAFKHLFSITPGQCRSGKNILKD
jgi:AraC family transcriptional regulator, transcriptional activator of the genes for pyochelin and ferripyochelin receptors